MSSTMWISWKENRLMVVVVLLCYYVDSSFRNQSTGKEKIHRFLFFFGLKPSKIKQSLKSLYDLKEEKLKRIDRLHYDIPICLIFFSPHSIYVLIHYYRKTSFFCLFIFLFEHAYQSIESNMWKIYTTDII